MPHVSQQSDNLTPEELQAQHEAREAQIREMAEKNSHERPHETEERTAQLRAYVDGQNEESAS